MKSKSERFPALSEHQAPPSPEPEAVAPLRPRSSDQIMGKDIQHTSTPKIVSENLTSDNDQNPIKEVSSDILCASSLHEQLK